MASHLQSENHEDWPSVSFACRCGGWGGDLKGFHEGDFHLGIDMENLWSDMESVGPGMDDGAVKSRLKTAKMERLARRTEMRRDESRGNGRPNMTCCLGIVEYRGVGLERRGQRIRRAEGESKVREEWQPFDWAWQSDAVTPDNRRELLLFEGAAVPDRRMPTIARPLAVKATYRVANAYRGPRSQWECSGLESEEKEESSMRSLSGQVLQSTYAVSEAYIAQALHAVEADQINWEQRLAGTGPVRSKGLAPPV